MYRDEEPFAHGSIWYLRNPTDTQNGGTMLNMFRIPTQIWEPEGFLESLTSCAVLICDIPWKFMEIPV